MDKDTYMSAQHAEDYGLVDRIMLEESPIPLQNGFGTIPENVINKLRGMIREPGGYGQAPSIEKEKAAAQLKLLLMKGEKR